MRGSWFFFAAAAFVAVATSVGQAQTPLDERVAAALQEAVRTRLGREVEAHVSDMRVQWTATAAQGELPDVVARLEPNQRLGRPLRFLVFERSNLHRARGAAQAALRVRMPLMRAARAVARGSVVTASDVVEMWAEPTGITLRPLPRATEVVGAQATRDIAVGVTVTPAMIRQLPLVHRGDELVARASVGGIQVTGKAVARQAGRMGDVIRVINPDSGRALRGRIVGRREIEVEHGR